MRGNKSNQRNGRKIKREGERKGQFGFSDGKKGEEDGEKDERDERDERDPTPAFFNVKQDRIPIIITQDRHLGRLLDS